MPTSLDRPLRVGFLSSHNPLNPNDLSGMPYSTWNALDAAGLELVNLSGRDALPPSTSQRRSWRSHPALRGVKSIYQDTRAQLQRAMERSTAHTRLFNEAEMMTARTQALVDQAEVDVLFGLCISTMLYKLKTDLPLVYASDTTAHLINTTYPEYAGSSKKYLDACDEVEGWTLRRCAYFIPASNCTGDSAVNHYGVDRDRIRVAELGAHVVPDGMELDKRPPTRENIELVLVAADPKRKRLKLCIEVAETLRERGWNATLNFVGPYDRATDQSEAVKWWGRLKLADPEDREIHKGILNRSHWMILPSLAEAFGIAPCEAAHFGRPSVVTNVGGLPTVVQDGRTGAVVPADAGAGAFADAIIKYSEDAAAYSALSDAALERAHTALSWDAWARRVKAALIDAYNERI